MWERFPGLPYAAARLGSGSDVLGLDDAMSRDHDWGLRLNLLVPADAGRRPSTPRPRRRRLPASFGGSADPVRHDVGPRVRHRVQVETARDLAVSRLGVDPTHDLTPGDWLRLTGQAVLEVTAGEVFGDDAGELDGIRRRLEWYPDDLWRHVVAVDWARLGQELPFVGAHRRARRRARVAGRRGAARRRRDAPRPPARAALAAVRQVARHELRRPATGGRGHSLAGASAVGRGWREREAGLVEAVRRSAAAADAGLPASLTRVEPFWDRPYRGCARRRHGAREHR